LCLPCARPLLRQGIIPTGCGKWWPMAPILILQFMADDGPAYLGTWLRRRGIAFDVRRADEPLGFPERIDGYRALALLGGAMSANDDLPFIHTARRLIAQALRADVPMIGHCLGGQLMARSLGASVSASPQPEVGWHAMTRVDSPASEQWFGREPSPQVFQWHYEAFGLPTGAEPLAASSQCPHQAFAFGPHLAMQFHVEVDLEKIELWLSQRDRLYDEQQRIHATVHARQRIRDDSTRFLDAQQQLADRIYARWAKDLAISQ
jgi:GMP synthase-like glutamine amidotransferase